MPETAEPEDDLDRPVIELPPARKRDRVERSKETGNKPVCQGDAPDSPEPPPLPPTPPAGSATGQGAERPAVPKAGDASASKLSPGKSEESKSAKLPAEDVDQSSAADATAQKVVVSIAVVAVVVGILATIGSSGSSSHRSVSAPQNPPPLPQPSRLRVTESESSPLRASTPEATGSPNPISFATSPTASLPTPEPKLSQTERRKRIEQLLANGLKAFKAREYSQALSDCREAVSLDPNHAGAWSCMGWSMIKVERLNDAQDSFRKAIELDPSLADAWSGLAQVSVYQDNPAETYRVLSRLEKLDRDSANEVWARMDSYFCQKVAIQEYPALGILDSAFNADFRKRYALYQQQKPSYFSKGDWPIKLARETARALGPKAKYGSAR